MAREADLGFDQMHICVCTRLMHQTDCRYSLGLIIVAAMETLQDGVFLGFDASITAMVATPSAQNVVSHPSYVMCHMYMRSLCRVDIGRYPKIHCRARDFVPALYRPQTTSIRVSMSPETRRRV